MACTCGHAPEEHDPGCDLEDGDCPCIHYAEDVDAAGEPALRVSPTHPDDRS